MSNNDYTIWHNNNEVKPKIGRPYKYWARMAACENVNDSFFVPVVRIQTMWKNCWMYNKMFKNLGATCEFKAFRDALFRCNVCKKKQLHSQMNEGMECNNCGTKADFYKLKNGCTVQRVK